MRRALAAVLLVLLMGCGPDLRGLESGERGRVAEIVDGDTLALEGGLRVTLTGVEAPYGAAPYAREARAALERLALGRPAHLAYGGLKRIPRRAPQTANGDAAETRPETALAQVFVQSEGGRWLWLQRALVAEGAAWVRTRRDNAARAPDLLAVEAEARRARRGLWALTEYRVRTPAALAAEAADLPDDCRKRGAPFRIVEGGVTDVRESPRRVALSLGRGQDAPQIVVFGAAVEAWRAEGPAFASYKDQRVRAHGPAENRRGQHLCVDNPAQIELLSAP
ncbi:MAG: thermonuclease family protein [Hyphomonadaceae bacterium]